MRLRPIAAAVAVPLAVASLAACGESAVQKYAKTAPATIDQDARTAMGGLKSVHMAGTMDDNGSKLTLDMSLDTQGNCVGSVTSAGQKVNLISVAGSAVYMKAGASFWQGAAGMPAATAATFATKWVTGKALASFGSICNLSQLTKSINDSTVAEDKPKFLGTDKVGGVDVVKIQVVDKDKSSSTLYVAASAPHNVLQVAGPKSQGSVTFTQFNTPVKATAPAGAVNLDQQLGSN